MRNISFGLSRTIGCLGFFICGLSFFYKVNGAYGIIDYNMPSSEIEGATWLYVGTFVVCMIGLIVGQLIGASIPIRSDKFCAFLDDSRNSNWRHNRQRSV